MPKELRTILREIHYEAKNLVEFFETYGVGDGTPRVTDLLFKLNGKFDALTSAEQGQFYGMFRETYFMIVDRCLKAQRIPQIKAELKQLDKYSWNLGQEEAE